MGAERSSRWRILVTYEEICLVLLLEEDVCVLRSWRASVEPVHFNFVS